MAVRIPAPLADHAVAQHGVISVAELVQHVSRARIAANIEASRWRRVARGVVLMENGPLTYEQRAWVAVLAGRWNALAGPTAAAIDGLKGFESRDVHVVLQRGQAGLRVPGVVSHWSSFLDDEHVHPSRAPRRTRLPRSVLDSASWQTHDRMARANVLAAVQQRLVSPEQLAATLPSRGPCLHHEVIAQSILDADGGVASVPEHDFDMIVRRYHLPPPQRQAIRLRPSGGRYFLDADWFEFHVSSEVEGARTTSCRSPARMTWIGTTTWSLRGSVCCSSARTWSATAPSMSRPCCAAR